MGVCTDTTLTVLDYEVFGDAQGYHIQLATESIFILASMKLQSGKYAKKVSLHTAQVLWELHIMVIVPYHVVWPVTWTSITTRACSTTTRWIVNSSCYSSC